MDCDVLTFDGPTIEKEKWPLKFKISLFMVVGSMLMLVGAYTQHVWNTTFENDKELFAPISFQTPARIISSDNSIPSFGNLPSPAINGRTDKIPVRLIRDVNCVSFSCSSGGMPVIVNVNFVQVNTETTTIKTFPVIRNVEVLYEIETDYIPGAVITVSNNLTPFTFPEELITYLEENEKEVSAWRLEGTTKPDRNDGLAVGWTSEVFHVYIGE